jgi:hypothetical protein
MTVMKSARSLAQVAWVKSIARRTRNWAATLLSKFFLPLSQPIKIDYAGSNRKLVPPVLSIIQTSS